MCDRKLFFLIVGDEHPGSGTEGHFSFWLADGQSEALTWLCDCIFPETAVGQVACSDRPLAVLQFLLAGLILYKLMGKG